MGFLRVWGIALIVVLLHDIVLINVAPLNFTVIMKFFRVQAYTEIALFLVLYVGVIHIWK